MVVDPRENASSAIEDTPRPEMDTVKRLQFQVVRVNGSRMLQPDLCPSSTTLPKMVWVVLNVTLTTSK